MSASVFQVFTVGVGPSSSHTVGPMRAANRLVDELARTSSEPSPPPPDAAIPLDQVVRLTIELFGSLGATGRGHGSDRAVLAGLTGANPETVDPDDIDGLMADLRASGQLRLCGGQPPRQRVVDGFDPDHDLIFRPDQRLAYHPNALRFHVESDSRRIHRTFYSVGGGLVVADDGCGRPAVPPAEPVDLPHSFHSGAELLARCADSGLDIAELALRNEMARGRSRQQVKDDLLNLWSVMCECIAIGCRTEGVLPGGLGVRRRAPRMARQLNHHQGQDALSGLDWVSLWALAVNEQNAAGGRVVTAPTNGSAGIVPAVLRYATRFLPGADDDTVVDFLLAAGAIGAVYQDTASISGAEVGCQGEIGVASSMAAAGLCQVLGGSPAQVANAAEIGLEHHLGLTCDPVAGLVQVPCIERNAVGASTAITAARLALAGDGRHLVSLDQVIATMMATGADMSTKYKETSRGGLALSIVAC
ncbi:MAG: L-serine ammonia-lyase [Propionibacteriaceae bacterium]|nr:L-serine ammonia-lyase [Propionibacteriaceae bacterium]